MQSISDKPFVGRESLMQRLGTLLEEAVAGHGRIVTLCGEPGIGKTRIAEELCSIARSRDVDTAWGSCYEGGGAPLYWPWSLVMRDLLQSRGAGAVRRHLGSGAPVVAEAIPSVAEALPGLPTPKPVDSPAMARFRVFDAMAAFFRRASTDRPMLVVLDDLHWADELSLLLLSFMCRDVSGSKMLLVGTYLDVEGKKRQLLELTLGDLARERNYERVAVGRLDREAVRRYLAVVHDHDTSAELAELVYDRTDGNAFYVTEVARLLEGIPRGSEGAIRDIPLPDTVREVTGRRLDRLSAGCRDLLAVAAVIGREFDARTLAAARGEVGAEDQLALLDEGIASGLIEPTGDHGGRYRFCHVLVQQALLARLAPGELARLHARVVDALERKYGERVDAHARELVEHLEPAQAVLGTGKLLHFLAVAAQQAVASYAWEEARDLFSRALAVREGESEDEQTADLLLGLGQAQSALMDAGAMASCSRAFRIYESAGLLDRAVAVVSSGMYIEPEQRSGWREMAQKVLSMAEKGALSEIDKATVMLIHAAGLSSADSKERHRQLMEALDITRREGAARHEMWIMLNLSWASMEDRDITACAEWAREAYQLAVREGDLVVQCRARTIMTEISRSTGKATSTELSRDAKICLSIAEKLRDHQLIWHTLLNCETTAWARADWSDAKKMVEYSLSLLPSSLANNINLLHRAFCEYHTRCFDAGDRALELAVQMAERYPPPNQSRNYAANYAIWLAMLSGRTSQLDAAQRFLHEALDDARTTANLRAMAQVNRGMLAVIRGDRDAAAAAYDYLLQARERGEGAGTTATDAGINLGLFARTAGRMDDAVSHLRESVELCERAENTSSVMWSLFYLAETLLQRSRRGDREEAERILERLLEIAVRTGTGLVEDRARELMQRTGIVPGTAARSERPDGLTDREIEVLRLVAAGKTNKEIGRELFISTTTVNAHVRNVLEKIGAANRAEAASYATEHGLTAR